MFPLFQTEPCLKKHNFAEIPFPKQLSKTNDLELDPNLIEGNI